MHGKRFIAPLLAIHCFPSTALSSILHIETSASTCSVAVSSDFQCVFTREDPGDRQPAHATRLGVFVEEALRYVDERGMKLDAVAVSCGPGSYTGLRIGVSMAKGVCYGRNIPLIGVPTLELLCVPVLLYHDELPDDALLCPMIDARRMEVYAAVYDRALHAVRPVAADIVTADTYAEQLAQRPVWFFGNGAEKCRGLINHPHAHFLAGIQPEARMMHPLAEKAVREGRFEDTAYFEPFYLKDFVAGKPKRLF